MYFLSYVDNNIRHGDFTAKIRHPIEIGLEIYPYRGIMGILYEYD